jgi:hypothetical protein
MATLDQLPAEQRAIVELVVQRGRSYGALADVLQVPAERVRELARDALTELSPRTAARVEADWRGQVADYLLGQQDADESRSTRDYLKRSETARAWALSLLDSLDPLYPNGASPAVPEPGATEARPEPVAEPKSEQPAITAEERIRERARKQPVVAEKKEPEPEPEAAKPAPVREPGALSPEAQSALKRRRTIGLVAGLAVLAAIVVGILALAGVFSSDNKKSTASTGSTTTPAGSTTTPSSTTAQQPIQVLGQIVLHAVGTSRAQGIAYLVQQGPNKFVVVQAQVPPLPNNQKVAAYEVWLYNSNSNARSLGAQYTNAQGILQGRAPLPVDYQKFKSIDISRELFADRNAGHGKDSLLRGDFSTLAPVPQQQQGAGTTTTPAP